MRASIDTRHYRRLSGLFYALSCIAMIAPMAAFVIMAMITCTGNKLYIMTAVCIAAGILFIVDVIRKYKVRSATWVLFAGLCYLGQHLLLVACLMAGLVLLDEFLFTPLARYYKQKARINYEIDKRLAQAKVEGD